MGSKTALMRLMTINSGHMRIEITAFEAFKPVQMTSSTSSSPIIGGASARSSTPTSSPMPKRQPPSRGLTGGNFRLLQRLFVQINRVLRITQLTAISEDVVETAASALVVGHAT